MPPILDDIKDKLPDSINPEPAVQNLSKNQSGALFIVSLCIAVLLIGALVWLAITTSHDTKKDKENEAQNYRIQLAQLQHNDSVQDTEIEYLRNKVVDYRDSLIQERNNNILHQFNVTKGQKQFILTPKKEAK